MAQLADGEPAGADGCLEAGARVAALVADRGVDGTGEPRVRGHEQEQPAVRTEQLAHPAERADVVRDVLEHVEADDGVDLSADGLGRELLERRLENEDVLTTAETFAQQRRERRIGLDGDDV